MLSRSLSESDVSELCGGGSIKGPSPTDNDRDLIIGGHRMVAPSGGVAGNDEDGAGGAGAYLGYDRADVPPQPPRPVLPPKQRRGGGGFANDPPNGGAQRGGGGGTAVAPGNVAIGARL